MGESCGIILATRSALNGTSRQVHTRTAAQEAFVRRAIAQAHACALRRTLDRRKRECSPAVRTRPLSGSLFSGGRRISTCVGTHRVYDPTLRSRAHVLV